jgi:acyl carrier protein phosphodiesterase
MNYLAHVFLAEDDPQCLLGNLLADILKRKDFDFLPERIQRGVRQHRKVDAFTDRHPVVLRSMRRLSEKWGWFSGIIIDVYYDHLLTLAWEKYSDESMRKFVNRVYDIIRLNLDEMPEDCALLARRLVQHDRLTSYCHLDGISFALTKVSERICERMPKRSVQLQHSIVELQRNHDDLMEDFLEFFPQIIEYSMQWRIPSERATLVFPDAN